MEPGFEGQPDKTPSVGSLPRPAPVGEAGAAQNALERSGEPVQRPQMGRARLPRVPHWCKS
jgi:hypothetical protein